MVQSMSLDQSHGLFLLRRNKHTSVSREAIYPPLIPFSAIHVLVAHTHLYTHKTHALGLSPAPSLFASLTLLERPGTVGVA